MSNNKFAMVAKTFQGLEDVLRDELITLGADNVEIGNRMVSFDGDLEMLYKANFCLRSALRILKPIVRFTASDTDELYDFVRDFDWEKYIDPDATFAIDSTVYSAEFTHSKFVTYRVKDGIVDHFNDIFGRRPSIRLTGADVIFNVHIADRRVTISLDSSGEPLNRRGYRVDTTEAPINEVLAAGIILKTGWRGDTDFVDPMCGSGTFLIEAALIANNIYPGIYRKQFAFERWKDFDAELFATIAADDSQEREFRHHIYGGDISPEAVSVARQNVRAAHLDKNISLVCKAFEEWTTPPPSSILITNPPYGERLRPEKIEELYRVIGRTLKFHFAGYHAWILGYQGEHMDCIGLKPSVRFPILNGALECTLREYVLFDGKYDDFKADGGSVHNSDFNRESRPKVRHISESEWEERSETPRRRPRRDERHKEPRRKDTRRREHREERRESRREDKKREGLRRSAETRDRPRDDRYRDGKRRGVTNREYRHRDAVILPDKEPAISAEHAVQIDMAEGRRIRSRRGWMLKKNNPDTDRSADHEED